MEFRFWGTRGSIPVPGPGTLRYGGNTPCCEVRAKSGHVIIIDAGTGVINAGHRLMQEGYDQKPLDATMLITHTHWDHIQGFPFFRPFFQPNHRWSILGPRHAERRLEQLLDGQLVPAFSPLESLQNLKANLSFQEIGEGEFEIGSVKIKQIFVPHTTITLCFRFEEAGRAVVFATDLEYLGDEIEEQKKKMEKHFAGAEVLIHDGMFLNADYHRFKGWGHATAEDCLEMARRSGNKKLYIYHHDPNRDDDSLEALLAVVENLRQPGDPEVLLAKEGDAICW
jgi:phosphoribosyl 1,2-cyclic phosphodiesterase